MQVTPATYPNFIKTISPVLSNSVFKRIAKEENFEAVSKKASKYLSHNLNSNIFSYKDFFVDLYNSMLMNYRNEFVYKNEIVNKILLGKHSLNTTTILNEFRIGKSIADLVMLNGTSIVYEIKTEYDSPERLLSQIIEYRKSFLNVTIVTHHTVENKYESFLSKHNLTNIGLLVLTKRNTLKEKIKPCADDRYLDVSYMFKCLRKSEYSKLVKKYFGYLPNVPNTKFFKECFNMALEINEREFHDLMFYHLKNRSLNEKKILSSTEIPAFLKHITISSNFKKRDLEKINLFLNKNL
ncbi:sce7726 family protein [Flavobacteriaceae bacterium LMO-SS05]